MKNPKRIIMFGRFGWAIGTVVSIIFIGNNIDEFNVVTAFALSFFASFFAKALGLIVGHFSQGNNRCGID